MSGSGKAWVFKKNQCDCTTATPPPEEAPESLATFSTESPTAASTETATATQTIEEAETADAETAETAPEAEPESDSKTEDAVTEAEPQADSQPDEAALAGDSETESKALTDTGEIPVHVSEPATTTPEAPSSDADVSTELPSSETGAPVGSVSPSSGPEDALSTPESPPAEPDQLAESNSPSKSESPGEPESPIAEQAQPSESNSSSESESSGESEPDELDSIVCTVESAKGQPLPASTDDSGTWARSPRSLPEPPKADPVLQNSVLIHQPQLHVPPHLLVGTEPSAVDSQKRSMTGPPLPIASPQPPISSPPPASIESLQSSIGSHQPSIGSPPPSILSNSATFSTSSTYSPSPAVSQPPPAGTVIPPAEPPIVNGSWVSLTNIRADDVSTPPRSFKALPHGKPISSAAKDVLSSTVSEIKSGSKGSGKKTNDYSMPSSSRHLILSAKESVKKDLRAKGVSVGKDYGSFPSDSVEMTTSLPKEPESKVVDDLLPPHVVQSGTNLGTTSGDFTSSSNSGVRSTSGYNSGVRTTSGANHDLIITSGPALTSTSSGTSIMSTTSATGLNYEDMSSGVRSATDGGADSEQDAHWVPVTKKSREMAQSHFKHDSELLNLVHPVEKAEEHDPSTTRKTIMEAFRRTKIKSLISLVIAIAVAWVGYQYISIQAIANKQAQLNAQINAQSSATKPKPTTHTPQHKSVRTTKKAKRSH